MICSLAQAGLGLLRHGQLNFVDVAPGPSFAGLEGCHDGVARVLEVVRGVAAGRTIAAADVATAQAEPQMDPGGAELQALFTAWSAGGDGGETVHVMAAHCRTSAEETRGRFYSKTCAEWGKKFSPSEGRRDSAIVRKAVVRVHWRGSQFALL